MDTSRVDGVKAPQHRGTPGSTGFGATSFLNPTYAPRNTSGTETPNHRTTNVNSVETGTAPELPTLSNEISITRKHANVNPGTSVAVSSVLSIQSVPLNDLYKRAAAWPPAPPANTYNMSNAVINEPRLAGDRNPNSAKVNVSKTMHPNCTPEPMHTENNMGEKDGGRKTSACTNFQPDSSFASSSKAASL